MTSMKNLALALMACLVLSLPAGVMADQSKDWKKEREKRSHSKGKNVLAHKALWKAHFYLKNADELNLTDEQRDKIVTIKIDLKKKLIRDNAEIQATKIDLFAALHKDDLDAIKIHSTIDKKYELKKGLAKASVQAIIDLNGLLTPEQKEKTKELWKKQRKKSRYSKDKGRCPYSY